MDQLTDEQVERRLTDALANRSSVSSEKLIAGLLRTFNLTADAADEFIFPALNSTARERIFGGQVIAQAIVAADHTVDDEKNIHSLHSYFLRLAMKQSRCIFGFIATLMGVASPIAGSLSGRMTRSSSI